LTQTTVLSLAIDPKTPSIVYAGTSFGIFKSTDGATSWVAGPTLTCSALVIDPVTPTTIYAGNSPTDVFKSTDGGRNWFPVDAGLPLQAGCLAEQCFVDALAIDPRSPSTLYAGTQNGVFKSANGGGSFSGANAGLAGLKVFALAVDPSVSTTVYAGTDLGVFKSVDGAGTWTRLLNGLNETAVFALALLPGSASTICAGSADGLFRSTDGGASWTQILLNHGTYALAVDPSSPTTLYEGGADGVGQSTDGGVTWNPFGNLASALPSVNALAVDPRSATTVYAGTDAGAYKTAIEPISNKLKWFTNSALASRRIFAVVLDPSSSSTLYAGTDGGLYKSIDAGISWTPITNGLTATRVFALTFDRTSSTFYAGTNGGVFKSADGGASWVPTNQGLRNLVVNAVAVAPGSSETLYAGTAGNSVFQVGSPGSCVAGSEVLCLSGSRFRVRVTWRAADLGTSGAGQAAPLTSDTGYFWFFQSTNVELVIKVLDARAVNGKFWVFYGALSNVEYTITVTDTVTGEAKTYFNPQNTLASAADTSAFPLSGGASGMTEASSATERVPSPPGVLRMPPERPAACVAGPTALCLSSARFRVEVAWRSAAQGTSGAGQAAPLTSDTGTFWFFQSTNVELILKVLDARAVNGHFWVFYGALSNVEYTITVTDTLTGAVKTYFNPQDTLASSADTLAF
jgi:hypothetical protein